MITSKTADAIAFITRPTAALVDAGVLGRVLVFLRAVGYVPPVHPSLSHGISHVVGLSTSAQMGRIHAGKIVTNIVANHHAVRYGTNVKLIGDPVSLEAFPVMIDGSVALGLSWPVPLPASALGNGPAVLEKSLKDIHALSISRVADYTVTR